MGSDVPYCVRGGTALAEGRGERLTPLPPLPSCYAVLCKPAFRAGNSCEECLGIALRQGVSGALRGLRPVEALGVSTGCAYGAARIPAD